MAHAHRMLDKQGYIPTLRICNAYCFPMATVVTGKRLNVTFIRTLSFLLWLTAWGKLGLRMKDLFSSVKSSHPLTKPKYLLSCAQTFL